MKLLIKEIFLILIPLILAAYFANSVLSSQKKMPNADLGSGTKNVKLQDIKIKDNPSEYVNYALGCKTCHLTEYPTRNDPGLLNCPRENMAPINHKLNEGPDAVVIDEMSDKYGGVVFSHKIHAEMSEMAGGCTGCHHYNTTGPVLNCRHCHEKTRNRKDISVPDLKAAFHRQCMTCHKQWSSENGCGSQCHLRKGTDKQQTVESVSGISHPELKQPAKITWETNSKVSKSVNFLHDEHVSVFNINCISCHTDESCVKCHSAKNLVDYSRPVRIEKTEDGHHKPCINCHYGNSCSKCHNEMENMAFNHGKSTGWPLNSYHNGLACSKCHGNTMPYKKVDKNCVSCHKSFASSFDHKLLGFVFSEAHKDMDCESCHPNRVFEGDPKCSDCHDDKSYPADLPGKKTWE